MNIMVCPVCKKIQSDFMIRDYHCQCTDADYEAYKERIEKMKVQEKLFETEKMLKDVYEQNQEYENYIEKIEASNDAADRENELYLDYLKRKQVREEHKQKVAEQERREIAEREKRARIAEELLKENELREREKETRLERKKRKKRKQRENLKNIAKPVDDDPNWGKFKKSSKAKNDSYAFDNIEKTAAVIIWFLVLTILAVSTYFYITLT